ncbi:MAG: hypothetical protein EOS81_10675 [Mesorhizobium sp.]|uniref:hypothetical protein n=1 Tax=unclassified Mesorhizobium TaxID=325217 RepID=UPI000F762BD3|nr:MULTISPECIES: hypothetical protein [unclassified Mesorhizobium]RVC65050.1 hypothetical protein EN766_35080 [Mesorhizobium sp. M2A.F.Ca.ET.046.02.1.1]RVC66829.1 hypothetical protein EN759_17480 [Mesorhizobium sp. M00.F.Ca.ET.038.03.1.1]AZO38628.1 hypothetical protein EJ072_32375 [Mesorhizobium sp. M2A.F.Ca.ET.046.03.2.1]RWB37628.1 MAG: hypothetical protein EOQ44_32875 [Mesorhizobium sp.]RWE17929.1 MAG: hypothetical protein EOS76_17800 [Mesorhizobium sp.]
MSDRIEAFPQQDSVVVEVDDDSVAISQTDSHDGSEDRIAIFGKANVDALIEALKKARAVMV